MDDREYRGITALSEEAEETAAKLTDETEDEAEETEDEAEARIMSVRRKRRRSRERKNREREVLLQRGLLAAAAICLVLITAAGISRWRKAAEEKKRQQEEQELLEEEEELLSDSVLRYRDLVEYYAEEEGIEEYVPVLLAIMEAETKGERDDVMQSSESAGLEPNSLGPEDSIAQACDYFRGLVDRAEDLGCDTRSIIQAYNYGPGYLYYVAEHGGEHSFDLAVDYAEEMSGGRTARYTHYIADDNGNWMYLYGNMYYVKLVEQYLP